MACGCIARQKKIVKMLCKAGLTSMCLKAKERLARMEAAEQAK